MTTITNLLRKPGDWGYRWPEWRPEQSEAMEFLYESEKRISVLEAPPGIGKTTLATMFGRLYGGRVVVLTGTKQLQQQYNEDHVDTYSMKGMNNFQCLEETQDYYSVDVGPCHVGYECPLRKETVENENGVMVLKEEECTYYAAKDEWFDSRISVTNYSYYLHISNFDKNFKRPDVLICDEAHMIDDELLGFVTLKFSEKQLKKFGIKLLFTEDVDVFIAWLHDVHATLGQNFQLTKAAGGDNIRLRQSARGVAKTLEKLPVVEDAIDRGNRFLIEINKEDRFIELKPVFSRDFSGYLFGGVERIVLMSATIRPYDKFCKLVGLDANEADFLSIPSPYEPSRMPIWSWPVAFMSRKNEAEAHPKLVDAVDDIIEARPEHKGIIHTVSYARAEYILAHSRYAYRLVHHLGDANREEVIEEFKNAPPGTWLLSPSIEMGVDLPYDQCRTNVICKMPYGNLGSGQIRAQLKDDIFVYEMKAVHRLLQMIGRAMRAKDDWGETFILDVAADRMLQLRRKWVPGHIKQATKQIRGVENANLEGRSD